MNDALELRAVSRRYQSGDSTLDVLRQANLNLRPGEIVALVAPSGSGKSTLLHIAGLLDRPDSGSVFIGGRDASGLSDRDRTGLRRDRIGFVYQFHHLLPEFTALENVAMPALIAGCTPAASRDRARDLLERFGLQSRLNHSPGKLSGGEQQRVAIARALTNKPALLLADEPTGNLDVKTSQIVFAELLSAVRDQGIGALIATHNPELAAKMDRRVTLSDGRILSLR